MVTIKDIARKLNMSPSTVSRALHDSPHLPDHTKARVQKCAADLGYRPHTQAAQLRSGQTKLLGLIVSSIQNPFFSALAYEVEQVAQEYGYQLLLANCDEDPDKQRQALTNMLNYRVEGLLFVPVVSPDEACMRALRHVPVVTIDRMLEQAPLNYVSSTSTQAAHELMTHVREAGFRHPALLLGPQETSTGRERTQALLNACAQAGFVHPQTLTLRYDRASGERAVDVLFGADALTPPPDVIISASGMIMLGVLSRLAQVGISPDEVGLVSYDALDLFTLYHPRITVIDNHSARMAREAVTMLLQMISESSNKNQTPITAAQATAKEPTTVSNSSSPLLQSASTQRPYVLASSATDNAAPASPVSDTTPDARSMLMPEQVPSIPSLARGVLIESTLVLRESTSEHVARRAHGASVSPQSFGAGDRTNDPLHHANIRDTNDDAPDPRIT